MGNEGYRFYENVLGSPKFILAPMVEQSELAFRCLSRELGSQLCYTPMWHAGIFASDEKYRKAAIESAPNDRPLLFQFCANDPEKFAAACALAEPHCDGVDLNLGCPQVIAQRGHYGAFLMEEWELVEKIIRTASERIKKPITCKIRIYKSIEHTVEYAKRLEKAGAKIVTVHGRLREQKGPLTGVADWEHIKAVKENLSIPVFANGNIQYLRDVERCFEYTKVDGVMTAEGALYNPAIFTGRQPPAWEMVDKYISYAREHTPPLGYIRGHLFRMWHHCLCKYKDLRTPLGVAKSFDALVEVSNQLKHLCKKDAEKDIAEGRDSEELDKLPYWRCQPYVRPPQKNAGKRAHEELSSDEPKKDRSHTRRKMLRQKHFEHGKGLFPKTAREKWPLCTVCLVNPWGSKCEFKRCRKCCKQKSAVEIQDCQVHRVWYHSNLVANPRKKKSETTDSGQIDSDNKNDTFNESSPVVKNTNNTSNESLRFVKDTNDSSEKSSLDVDNTSVGSQDVSGDDHAMEQAVT
ncbi:tRNA-dihydrouridine(16/17) synthase [NAD(P)(+)]-like [Hydractinia symbiolongicarpus]|uniref:tRNA-dihydrouridine(16/17) synthase [NAD(P)(+)]-like n=1 Tax=Hydractinia symbiolongicarpus TaxID=13093 RepID=UPI002550B4F1|nr:tRNA-dihydrouridine(16/17) synthase [NAD(P)(+)]-like [Hydractinia symbiolongicarpus]